MEARAITIAILAMGGEGGGVLADWIVDVAEHAGYLAQNTSVPGVAQRTGSTIYYIELFPESAAAAAGKEPVLALMPVPGEVDVVIASELMEAGRAVARGLVTPERTTVIASTHRVYSMAERTAVGDGRVDSAALLDGTREAAKHFIAADFAAIAANAGSVISAALFGALAGSAVLPFPTAQFEEAIRRGGVGVENSLAAFHSAASGQAPVPRDPPASAPGIERRIAGEFPASCHEILQAGYVRLIDYQDERYASDYLDRLAPVRDGDHGDYALLRETARYLALWMSYEDAIRVADLKSRAERFRRVRQEARVAPGQLVEVHEYLYPRVQELADILPAGLGRWLLASAWAGRVIEFLTRGGQILETTSVTGYSKLRLLARMRRRRRGSLRFGTEQQKINVWLATVVALAAEDYALACEVAECPQLMRGYSDTHARGSVAFDELMAKVPGLRGTPDGAGRFKELIAACDR
jgi:indolepyruvate ferredoxin oxidoreductase, beta subunit